MTKACQSLSLSEIIKCLYTGIPRLQVLGELIQSPKAYVAGSSGQVWHPGYQALPWSSLQATPCREALQT